MDVYLQRWTAVQQRITEACKAVGRAPQTVSLLAVGKQHPANAVAALHALGQREFGENRVAEARAKQQELAGLDISWHFIGPVQSNKTSDLAARFQWVQSVDREKILQRLNDQRPDQLPPLNICLQVNIDREPQKAGLEPEQLPAMARLADDLPRLRLRGLMCIPRADASPAATRASFAHLRELYAKLCADGLALDTLSMGMSADLELAIAEGSTMIRVGSDLFGARQPRA